MSQSHQEHVAERIAQLASGTAPQKSREDAGDSGGELRLGEAAVQKLRSQYTQDQPIRFDPPHRRTSINHMDLLRTHVQSALHDGTQPMATTATHPSPSFQRFVGTSGAGSFIFLLLFTGLYVQGALSPIAYTTVSVFLAILAVGLLATWRVLRTQR